LLQATASRPKNPLLIRATDRARPLPGVSAFPQLFLLPPIEGCRFLAFFFLPELEPKANQTAAPPLLPSINKWKAIPDSSPFCCSPLFPDKLLSPSRFFPSFISLRGQFSHPPSGRRPSITLNLISTSSLQAHLFGCRPPCLPPYLFAFLFCHPSS